MPTNHTLTLPQASALQCLAGAVSPRSHLPWSQQMCCRGRSLPLSWTASPAPPHHSPTASVLAPFCPENARGRGGCVRPLGTERVPGPHASTHRCEPLSSVVRCLECSRCRVLPQQAPRGPVPGRPHPAGLKRTSSTVRKSPRLEGLRPLLEHTLARGRGCRWPGGWGPFLGAGMLDAVRQP